MKKLILSFFILVFIGIGFHQYKFSVISLSKVPKLLSRMRAKEFCTCYFLLEKGEDYCLKFVLKGYPQFDFALDKVAQKVTFSNPIASTTAQVVEKQYGCRLLD